MANFERGETVIISAVVRNTSDVLADPATSMEISIANPAGVVVVATTGMTDDAGVGYWHYDYAIPADAPLGEHVVTITATDASRVTIVRDKFTVIE